MPNSNKHDTSEQRTDHDVDYTGEDAENRLVLCVPCREYQPLNETGHPECDHSISEAKDIGHLDALTWAYIRLRAYREELERDPTRGSETILQSKIMSLASDLTFAGEDVPTPENIDAAIDERLNQ